MRMNIHGHDNNILYTVLSSPNLISTLYRYETSPILDFAHSAIFLHNPFGIIQLAQCKICYDGGGQKVR